MSDIQRTELSAIGEFGLIDRLKEKFGKLRNAQSQLGIGDDAAIFSVPEGEQVLMSTDVLAEGIHFDLSFTPLKHLGYKAIAVNVSDIAAMNAKPSQVVVSVAISNRFSVEAIEELYAGMYQACEDYKVDLVGGDTSSSRSGLVINVCAVGTQKPEKIAKRSGAKVGDVLCVSGDLGAAYLGLQTLLREKEVFKVNPDFQPDLEQYSYVLERQLKPEARVDFVYEMEEAGVVPSAMIDISDGLASEILHLCKHSGVGAAVYEEQIPIADATHLVASEFKISPTTCAMNGGEDYELLFTLSLNDFEKVRHLPMVLPIGIIREASEGALLITAANNAYPIEAQGWQHFEG